MKTANYIVQWVLAGVSLLGSLGACVGWIKAKKQSQEAMREAERAKEYASNANEANIAARKYYELAIKAMEKENSVIDIQIKKDEIKKFILKNTFCKTKDIAEHLSISEDDAYNLLYEMKMVDGSISAAGQIRQNNPALTWCPKSKQ